MRKIDCEYTTTIERILAYRQIPELERLRWLDELVRFTLMFRSASDDTKSEIKQLPPS